MNYTVFFISDTPASLSRQGITKYNCLLDDNGLQLPIPPPETQLIHMTEQSFIVHKLIQCYYITKSLNYYVYVQTIYMKINTVTIRLKCLHIQTIEVIMNILRLQCCKQHLRSSYHNAI